MPLPIKTKNKDREIPLTPEQYADLKRALMWPEEREHYDRVSKPTRLTELTFADSDKTD